MKARALVDAEVDAQAVDAEGGEAFDPPEAGASIERVDAGLVEVTYDADVDAEADRVADWFARVRAERAAAGEQTTGAVLFRAKKHMVRFADALGRRGIPHRILGLGGLLSTPEVVDVVAALRVLSDPQAGSALSRSAPPSRSSPASERSG